MSMLEIEVIQERKVDTTENKNDDNDGVTDLLKETAGILSLLVKEDEKSFLKPEDVEKYKQAFHDFEDPKDETISTRVNRCFTSI